MRKEHKHKRLDKDGDVLVEEIMNIPSLVSAEQARERELVAWHAATELGTPERSA